MRKGKIAIENLSGGELTASPLLSSPPKYSRLLQNFYINAEGHIAKIPGYSSVCNQISNIQLTSGIDFKKSDGTSIKIVGGRTQSLAASKSMVANGISTRLAVFTGSGVNDLTTNTVYTGTGTAVFTVKVAQAYPSPQYDIWAWKKDSGVWNYFGGTDPLPPTINLSDGVTISIATSSDHTQNDQWVITCHNPHLDDAAITGTYSGAAACTFEVIIDAEGTPDTFKWRKDSGAYTTGVAITGAAQLLSDGISITFLATTGHSYSAKWTITASPVTTTGALYRLDNGNLSIIKSDFVSTLPIYMGQVGDIIVAGNYVDRPVAYDGSTFQNINLPFGNSTVFAGVGLNDFAANISFTYESAVYVVEIDGIAISTPSITFGGGSGKNDLKVPSVNYSGALSTANFDIAIDSQGTKDTFKYNVNGGAFVTGVDCATTVATANVAGGIHVKANDLTGHLTTDILEFQITEVIPGPLGTGTGKFKYRLNGGAWSADTAMGHHPTYAGTGGVWSISADDIGILTVGDVYSIQVDGANVADTFKWRKDSEAYTENVPIVVGPITLKEGVTIQFDYMTGHSSSAGNTWTFDVARDTVKYSKDGTDVSTGEIITGEYQTIQSGVQFKFSAINGHTLSDKWTMPIDQSIRFGKMYPYKNRMWTIGADKLTAYYSDLLKPTDFTGSGAGYLDFRFVIPEGDELVDIGSIQNYIIFFFKNHIVIYAGTDPTAEGDFAIFQLIAGLGVVAVNSIVNVGSDIFFLTNKGVKGLKQIINAGSLNVDNVSSAIDLDIIAAIDSNTSGVYASAHYATLGFFMFLIGTKMFIFNYRQKAWSRILIPSADNVSKILSMFESKDGFVYMGGYDYLFEFDPTPDTYNFNGVAPVYRWTSAMFKATTADSLYFNEFMLRLASVKAATLMLKTRAIGFDTPVEDQATFNEQTIAVPAITVADAVLNFVRAPLFGAGKYIQFDITETPNYVDNDDVEIVSVEASGELGIL